MAKQILYDMNARQKLTSGMETLARAVRATLGPTGKNVILDKKFSRPHSTKDGVTVSKEVELPDPFENMGAKIINEVASRTNDKVGDRVLYGKYSGSEVKISGVEHSILRESEILAVLE